MVVAIRCKAQSITIFERLSVGPILSGPDQASSSRTSFVSSCSHSTRYWVQGAMTMIPLHTRPSSVVCYELVFVDTVSFCPRFGTKYCSMNGPDYSRCSWSVTCLQALEPINCLDETGTSKSTVKTCAVVDLLMMSAALLSLAQRHITQANMVAYAFEPRSFGRAYVVAFNTDWTSPAEGLSKCSFEPTSTQAGNPSASRMLSSHEIRLGR